MTSPDWNEFHFTCQNPNCRFKFKSFKTRIDEGVKCGQCFSCEKKKMNFNSDKNKRRSQEPLIEANDSESPTKRKNGIGKMLGQGEYKKFKIDQKKMDSHKLKMMEFYDDMYDQDIEENEDIDSILYGISKTSSQINYFKKKGSYRYDEKKRIHYSSQKYNQNLYENNIQNEDIITHTQKGNDSIKQKMEKKKNKNVKEKKKKKKCKKKKKKKKNVKKKVKEEEIELMKDEDLFLYVDEYDVPISTTISKTNENITPVSNNNNNIKISKKHTFNQNNKNHSDCDCDCDCDYDYEIKHKKKINDLNSFNDIYINNEKKKKNEKYLSIYENNECEYKLRNKNYIKNCNDLKNIYNSYYMYDYFKEEKKSIVETNEDEVQKKYENKERKAYSFKRGMTFRGHDNGRERRERRGRRGNYYEGSTSYYRYNSNVGETIKHQYLCKCGNIWTSSNNWKKKCNRCNAFILPNKTITSPL